MGTCNFHGDNKGITVQIGTVRFLGLFLPDSQWHTVPLQVVQYVAAQPVGCMPAPGCMMNRPAGYRSFSTMFCFTSSRANKWRRPCLPGSLPSLVLYHPKLYDLDFGEVGVLELPATGQVLLPSYWFIDVLQRTEKRPGEASFLLKI
jgi:hypothetical protein